MLVSRHRPEKLIDDLLADCHCLSARVDVQLHILQTGSLLNLAMLVLVVQSAAKL